MLLSLNNDMPMANDKYENGNKNKKEFLNNQNKVKGSEMAVVNSDSDEEPEDISIKASKAASIKQIRNAVDQIKDLQKKKREKNKKHSELFTAQKLARIERLEQCRLPEDIMQQITQEATTDVTSEKNTEIELIESSNRIKTFEDDDNEDFVPLESKPCQVEIVTVKDLNSLTSAHAAANFKQTALYGSRVKRVPVKSHLATSAKRRARFH